MKIIMLGAPGAGKGTQAERISKKYQIPHISTGDILRSNIKNKTELGMQAKSYMDAGGLVPDELVIRLVVDRLSQADAANGYVFDGFPRTINQAEALGKALEEQGDKIDVVIDVDAQDEAIIKRLSGRRVCGGCSATYHVVNIPTKVENICDGCDSELTIRADDEPETIKKRLAVYHKETQPLVDYYKNLGLLKTVDGMKGIEKSFADIVDILGSLSN